jgi:O-antigen/teichoic acid export membrane protein
MLMKSIRLSTLYALPVFIVICLLSPWVMAFFGKGYEEYWYVLVILSVGYFVNAVTGPIAQLLIMVEQEKLLRNITLMTGVFSVVAALLFTATMGLTGAALATGLVLILQNIVVLGQVSKLYRGRTLLHQGRNVGDLS